ncbi:MAG: DUF4384 domain-containing protein [Betaproteobacteria bacterium]|nr:DUF4384 domain-containing protein [Betaproteobacteria bacterium]MDE2055953.1 DUF4384 domain-containing protein [Betaproteobacteria bacterium]
MGNNIQLIKRVVALLILGSVQYAWSMTEEGNGVYYFGPETSEARACQAALEAAKLDALRNVGGERFSQDETMICSENEKSGDAATQCLLNKLTWSQIGGDIQSIHVTKQVVSDELGKRRCEVNITAQVSVSPGVNNPALDSVVSLNQSIYRPGEDLTLQIVPQQPVYLTVFNWIPYAKEIEQVTKIFPNKMEQNNHVSHELTLPSKQYDHWRVDLPDRIPANRRVLDEYVMVVVSKEPITWQTNYSFDAFRNKLAELPIDQVRLFKRGFQIMIPQQSQ